VVEQVVKVEIHTDQVVALMVPLEDLAVVVTLILMLLEDLPLVQETHLLFLLLKEMTEQMVWLQTLMVLLKMVVAEVVPVLLDQEQVPQVMVVLLIQVEQVEQEQQVQSMRHQL
tara:strand:- start:289 stop:630 length:342 start_codon:yes stop_codon:yes gene_type:complete